MDNDIIIILDDKYWKMIPMAIYVIKPLELDGIGGFPPKFSELMSVRLKEKKQDTYVLSMFF